MRHQDAKEQVDRYLTLLRTLMRQHGYTQEKIQDALGWGKTYISQLMTSQKCLRLEQVLLILKAIGADPAEFFRELYHQRAPTPDHHEATPAPPEPLPVPEDPHPHEEAPQTITRYRLELVREEDVPLRVKYGHYYGPSSAERLLREVLPHYAQEIMGSLLLDIRGDFIGYTITYIGTRKSLHAEPRDLLLPALFANASAVVLFHTHPSGDPSPSKADKKLTKRVADAAELLGLDLEDHVILGEEGRYHAMSAWPDWPVTPRLPSWDD